MTVARWTILKDDILIWEKLDFFIALLLHI